MIRRRKSPKESLFDSAGGGSGDGGRSGSSGDTSALIFLEEMTLPTKRLKDPFLRRSIDDNVADRSLSGDFFDSDGSWSSSLLKSRFASVFRLGGRFGGSDSPVETGFTAGSRSGCKRFECMIRPRKRPMDPFLDKISFRRSSFHDASLISMSLELAFILGAAFVVPFVPSTCTLKNSIQFELIEFDSTRFDYDHYSIIIILLVTF